MSTPPKPLRDEATPEYPSLSEYRDTRRGFLRRLAVGGLAFGLGGRLIAACDTPSLPRAGSVAAKSTQKDNTTLDTDEDTSTNTTDKDKKHTISPSYDVRMPEEGFDWVFDDGGFSYDSGEEMGIEVQYALVLTTNDADLAAYYEKNRDAGLDVAGEVVKSYDCEDFDDPSKMEQIRNLLRDALSEHYIEETGKNTTGVVEISLTTEYCSEYWVTAGVAPDPDYPDGY